MTLAFRIDSQPKMNGTALSSLSRELRVILDELVSHAVIEDDPLTILRKRRAERVGEKALTW
jgi:hypothetical protein